jgi:hypothetical protein
MSETQTAIVSKQETLARLNEKVGELIATGEKITVTDAASCLWAKQFSVSVKSYQKAVDLYADGDIQDAKERLSTLQAAKKMLLAPVVAIFEAVETKRKRWEEDERRKAEAEQRRLQEEARATQEKKAREEREERERIAAEARKRLEKELAEARKAGEINKRELEKAQKEAREAEARERAAAEVEAKRTAAAVPQVEVKASIPTLQGTRSARVWKFRVKDANKVPRLYLMVDEVAIGKDVRKIENGESAEAHKLRVEALIPGIEVYSE